MTVNSFLGLVLGSPTFGSGPFLLRPFTGRVNHGRAKKCGLIIPTGRTCHSFHLESRQTKRNEAIQSNMRSQSRLTEKQGPSLLSTISRLVHEHSVGWLGVRCHVCTRVLVTSRSARETRVVDIGSRSKCSNSIQLEWRNFLTFLFPHVSKFCHLSDQQITAVFFCSQTPESPVRNRGQGVRDIPLSIAGIAGIAGR